VQSFSREGTECAAEVKDKKIALIDGIRLTRLMIDAGIGVSVPRAAPGGVSS
jgi:restriction endonuclease Mrr